MANKSGRDDAKRTKRNSKCNTNRNGGGGREASSEKPLLPLKLDVVFKRVFGDRNAPEILADFLSAALDMPVEDFDNLEISDPALLPEYVGDKLSILDVRIFMKDGKAIDVEIQQQDVDAMEERCVYMNARMLAGQLQIGQNYGILKRAISIIITNFRMVREDEMYHHRFVMHDPRAGVTFTDIMQVDLLELPKLPSERDESRLWNWLRVIDKVEDKGMEQEIERIMEENPMIGKAVMKLREMSADEVEREIAFRRMIAIADEQGRLEYARKEGLDEGRKEGEAKGIKKGEAKARREDAARMKATGIDIALIEKITGLSAEEIASL